jgi:cytochrome c5
LAYCIFFLAANFQSLPGQTGTVKVSAIPDNIKKIFESSCYGCHGANGKLLPKTKLDFSKWTEYDAVKGAEKAAGICNELAEEAMPPKSVRKSNPELIPKGTDPAYL